MIDVTVDGADEADPNWNLIKDLGGALVQDKIVASAPRRSMNLSQNSPGPVQYGVWHLPENYPCHRAGRSAGEPRPLTPEPAALIAVRTANDAGSSRPANIDGPNAYISVGIAIPPGQDFRLLEQ